MPKPWPEKPVARKKPGTLSTGRDDRHGVGHHIDQPGPLLRHSRLREDREGLGEAGPGLVVERRVGLGVEHADLLERRGLVQLPALRRAPLLERSAPPSRKCSASAPARRAGRKSAASRSCRAPRRRSYGRPLAIDVAAVQRACGKRSRPSEHRVPGAPSSGSVRITDPSDLELRQAQAEAAAEQARPGPAGEHHRCRRRCGLFP